MTQRETKALSSPPAPPSLPGRAPSRLRAPADSWWLVLGAQTQESLLSRSTDPSRVGKEGVPRAPAAPSTQGRTGRGAPFHSGEHVRDWAPQDGVLHQACHGQGHIPGQQSHTGRKGRSKAAWRTNLLTLPARLHVPHPPAPETALALEPDRHRTSPSPVVWGLA